MTEQMNTPSWCLNTEKYEAVQIPPTPWYVGEMNENGIRVAPVDDPRNAVAYAFDEANAAHIVKCVNSHDSLVKALRWALLRIETSLGLFLGEPDCGDKFKEARAALAAAEAE